MVLEAAPIASVERIVTDKIDRAGDVAPGPLRHDEEDAVAQALRRNGEKGAVEVRPAPFARAGIHVESEEGVPVRLGDIAPGHPLDRDAIAKRIAPLAADGLSLARGESGQKIVERRIGLVEPMELLAAAGEEALPGQ